MASIEARTGQKKTSFRVIWRDTDGQKQSKTWPTKERAELWKALIESVNGDESKAAEHLARQASQAMTLNAASDHRMGLLRADEFTVQTYEIYMRKHISPYFGEWPIDTITEDDCTRFVLSLEKKNLSPKYIHNITGWLTSVFLHAIARGWAPANPMNPKVLPEVIHSDETEADKFLTREEAQAIISRMLERHQVPAQLMLGTGMRPAEMRALTVGDVYLDAAQPVVRVTKAIRQDRKLGERLGPTKTRRSVRSLGIPPSLIEALKPHVEGRKGSEYLFPGKAGQWIPASTFTQAFARGVKLATAAELLTKKPGPYSLRHTHASLMIDAGMDMYKLSRHMGHATQKITEDTYVHLYPDAQYEAANFAAIALGEAPKQLTA